ncbi:uncharacterized protein LOC103521600 [Diaphorina citri]|uniref:Uncharacterized protein LOC103521600 n=1 Tax=Diaphorina citri TaxID=121845 RepID=A0A1S3DPC8_DIACI|nr:uncharacterized protein LOC103521600 [Diaphorina citri]
MKENHDIENCHELTANEQYLYSSEDDDISSSDDMDQSCLPERFRIEIPEPSTAVDFESFVLYKYGRDYLKAKRLVEDRDEEKQYSDGISNLQESLDSPNKNVSSDNTLPEITKKPEVKSTDEFDRNDFAFSVESFIQNQIRKKLKAYWKEESSENGPPGEGSLRVYDKESGKYGDFSLPGKNICNVIEAVWTNIMSSLDGHKITMSQLSATSIQHEENTTTTSVPKSEEEDDVEDIEFPKNVLSELFDDAFIKIIDRR